MALIVAIEKNGQQAAQLKSIVQGIGAELVLAQSAEHAFEAVENRVPDLILIPLLLSPQDDAALANRLRQLGHAGSHIRTLSIPILATPCESPGGKLSILRVAKEKDGPLGCAPEVFAGQLREYLDGAARDKEWAAARAPDPPIPPSVACTTNETEGVEGDEGQGASVVQPPEPAKAAPETAGHPTLDERRAIADAARKAAVGRAAASVGEANAGEVAIAAAEARIADEQRAAEQALQAAADARCREEQAAAQAAAETDKAEARMHAAEQAARVAAEARVAEEQRAARAAAEAKASEARRVKAETQAKTWEERRIRSMADARTAEMRREAAEAARAALDARDAGDPPMVNAVADRDAEAPRPAEPAAVRRPRRSTPKTKEKRLDDGLPEGSVFFDSHDVGLAEIVAKLDEVTGTVQKPRPRGTRY